MIYNKQEVSKPKRIPKARLAERRVRYILSGFPAREITSAVATINRAEKVLREHGWRKGSLGNEREGFCALGAINKANGPGEDAAKEAVEAALPGAYRVLASFNDSPTTEPGHILALFERAKKFLIREKARRAAARAKGAAA